MSDTTSGYPGAPPDWYPDPAGGPGRRWWDGYAWTDAVVLPTQPPPPPPAAAPADGSPWAVPPFPVYRTAPGSPPARDARGLLVTELQIRSLARLAVVVIAVYYLWVFVTIVVNRAIYRSLGHQIRVAYRAAEHNQPTPRLTIAHQAGGGFVAVGGVLALASVAAVVIACMWQYRAASTARALGYPAKHSAGWGVGSWFVPIVHLWMPYQAIRDCLPGDDPSRSLVRWFWTAFIGMEIFAVAAVITAMISTSASVAVSIPGALLCLGMMATAPRFVDAIAAAHRATLEPGGVTTPVTR